MQISYHSSFTKIKITKLKKKKKKEAYLCTARYTWYRLKRPKLADTINARLVRPVFKPVWNVDDLVPVHVPIQYIPAVPASTVWYRPPWFKWKIYFWSTSWTLFSSILIFFPSQFSYKIWASRSFGLDLPPLYIWSNYSME